MSAPGRDAVGGTDETSDLRGQDVLVARPVAQARTEPALAGPVAVERSDVEGSDAQVPGVLDGRDGLVVVDGAEQAADRCRPEPEPGHLDIGPTDPDACEWVVRHRRSFSPISTPEAIDATPSPRVSFNPSSTGQYTER